MPLVFAVGSVGCFGCLSVRTPCLLIGVVGVKAEGDVPLVVAFLEKLMWPCTLAFSELWRRSSWRGRGRGAHFFTFVFEVVLVLWCVCASPVVKGFSNVIQIIEDINHGVEPTDRVVLLGRVGVRVPLLRWTAGKLPGRIVQVVGHSVLVEGDFSYTGLSVWCTGG